MELRHLRYFVAVAEELHFGRAATRLHIAQPPLSRQIRQLEEELGVTLLDRSKRRVELTPAGRTFFVEARRVLTQSERAVRAAQRTSRGDLGPLSLGFVPAADLDLLPRALRLCRTRYPSFEVELHPMTRCQQADALRSGRIQMGLVLLPFDDGSSAVEPLVREPLVAVLPDGHRLARRDRVRMTDLRDETIVSFPRAPRGRDHMTESACRQAGFEPRLAYATDRIETNLSLVAAGIGVSLLPASIRNLKRVGVVYRPLLPPAPHVELAVTYPSDAASPSVTTFLQVLRDVTARTAKVRAATRALRAADGAPPAASA